MAPLLLTQPMYNAKTGRMVYTYPSAQRLTNQEVALVSMTYYNSFPNVSVTLQNNTIQFDIPSWTGTTYTPISDTLVLATGFYSIQDINLALWNYFVLRGYYLYDPVSKNNIYFLQMLVNAVTYSTQVNQFFVPDVGELATLGWTNPAGVITLRPTPLAGNPFYTPTITISPGMGNLTGINAGTLTHATSPTWTLSPVVTLGTKAPAINPVTSVIVRCNLINATIGQPTDMVAQVPLVSAYGAVDQFQAPYPVFSNVVNALYSTVEVYFMDQNLNVLFFFDPELTVTLELRDRPPKAATSVNAPEIVSNPVLAPPAALPIDVLTGIRKRNRYDER